MKKLIFLAFFSLLCINVKAQTVTIINHTCDDIGLNIWANNILSSPCFIEWAANGITVPAGTTAFYTKSTLPWVTPPGPPPATGTINYTGAGFGTLPCGNGSQIGSGICSTWPTSATYSGCNCSNTYTATFSLDPSGNLTITFS